MPVAAGCTATAPIDSEGASAVPALAAKTGSVSVNGAKVMPASVPAAFVLFQTPPPVVPSQTVLPAGSPGSSATAVIRPVIAPYSCEVTLTGPSGCQFAVRFAVEASGVARPPSSAACCPRARARASARVLAAPADNEAPTPRAAKNWCARARAAFASPSDGLGAPSGACASLRGATPPSARQIRAISHRRPGRARRRRGTERQQRWLAKRLGGKRQSWCGGLRQSRVPIGIGRDGKTCMHLGRKASGPMTPSCPSLAPAEGAVTPAIGG